MIKAVWFQANLSILLVFFWGGCTGGSNNPNQIPERSPREADHVISNDSDGKWQQAKENPLKLTLELTIGNDNDFMLPSSWEIIGPVANENGIIYFIDGVKNRMYAFDSTGAKRWETGNEGKGPGDFSQPRGIAINSTNLFISNINGTRIDRYSLNGSMIDNTALPEDQSFTSLVGFINDSLLVTESTLWGEVGGRVIIFNVQNGIRKVSEFDLPSDPPIKLASGFSSNFEFNVLDTLIATGNRGNYALQFYDKNGNYIKKVTRDFEKLVKPGLYTSGGGGSLHSFGGLNAPYRPLSNYHVTQYCWPDNLVDPDAYMKMASQGNKNRPELEYKTGMDLYDKNFNLLYVAVNEGRDYPIGRITFADGKGHLYAKTNNPFPQIRRYRVQVVSPRK